MKLPEFLFRLASDDSFRRDYKKHRDDPEAEFWTQADLDDDSIEYLKTLEGSKPCELRAEIHIETTGDDCGEHNIVFILHWLH